MEGLKFEILLPYYKRPRMVRNALDSVERQTYGNWHLTFIDDSGDDLFKETLEQYHFGDKAAYVATMHSEKDKRNQGGSAHGQFMNEAIRNSDADVVIILCDDDALTHEYLERLNVFYSSTDAVWSYCYLHFYDPLKERYENALRKPFDKRNGLNTYDEPIMPSCRVDSAQVTFRKFIFEKVQYPSPQTKNLDASMFQMVHTFWGNCVPNGIIGQVKGFSGDQLGCRTGNREYNPKDSTL